jgi:CBS domain containing-hemolysin-like protein
MILAALAIIVVLVVVNALYVAAEFAAVSVRRSRVQQMAEEGNGLARALLPTLQQPELLDRYIAGCQIGITVSSLVLGAYGQAALPGHIAPILEDFGGLQEAASQTVSAIFVLLFLTGIQVVLGELVPKSLALQFPTRVALYTTLPMKWSLVILRPFIAILNGSALAMLKPFHVGHASHTHAHSPQEIELLIAQSGDGGLLNSDERTRLRKALQIGNLVAADVMVPRRKMLAFEASMTIDAAIVAIADSPYTRVPVYRESIDDVLGLIHAKDLAIYDSATGGSDPITAVTRPMVTVPESLSVDRVLLTLRAQHAQQALVVDEHGGVAGLITLEDVLSEIFGAFDDEFKHGPGDSIIPLAGGGVGVPGSMPMVVARRFLPTGLPGTSHTLAGRLTEMAGYLPVEGERFEVDGATVVVEAVARRTIISLAIFPSGGAEVDDDAD